MGVPEADQHKTTSLAGAPQHVTNENLDVMESRGTEDHDKASDLMPFKGKFYYNFFCLQIYSFLRLLSSC